MPSEIIKKLADAESQSERREQDARKECEKIIADARKRADEIIAEAKEAAENAIVNAEKTALAQAEKMRSEHVSSFSDKLSMLKKSAEANLKRAEDEMIGIISEL